MTEQRDFAKDREICNAATEGPWNTARDQAYAFDAAKDYLEVWSVTDHKGRLICIDTQDFCGIENDETAGPNLQFIATARAGWPAALDEIERLKAEHESIRRMLSKVVRLLDVHTGSHEEIHKAYWLLSDYLEFGDIPNE